jgi:REP element-mobilizing transposase RayT
MIKKTRLDLPNRFLDIKLDEFIIMPNHFHWIIIIDNFPEIKKNTVVDNTNVVGADPCGRPICFVVKKRVEINPTPTNGQFEKLKKSSIGSIIWAFKSISTNEYIRLVKHWEFPDFEKAIRQRNFFENIIRNDRQLENIREYIIRNPEKWSEDSLFS